MGSVGEGGCWWGGSVWWQAGPPAWLQLPPTISEQARLHQASPADVIL